MRESVRTLIRTLPLDPTEPQAWSDRRMNAALLALSALHPRDEVEVMLGVQALSAYHAAAACWRIGMNLRRPNGDSTRHITAACSAARTFDSMLRALERRQGQTARHSGRPSRPQAMGRAPPQHRDERMDRTLPPRPSTPGPTHASRLLSSTTLRRGMLPNEVLTGSLTWDR